MKIASSNLFQQLCKDRWKKNAGGSEEFEPSPEECSRKRMLYTAKDVSFALAFILVIVCLTGAIINLLWTHVLTSCAIFTACMIILIVVIVKLYPGGKPGPLTTDLHFRWLRVKKLIKKTRLTKTHFKNADEVAQFLNNKIEALVLDIRRAQKNEENLALVARLKKELSNVFELANNLFEYVVPYSELYGSGIKVRTTPPGNLIIMKKP